MAFGGAALDQPEHDLAYPDRDLQHHCDGEYQLDDLHDHRGRLRIARDQADRDDREHGRFGLVDYAPGDVGQRHVAFGRLRVFERKAAKHREDEIDGETGADRDADLQPMAVHPRDAHVPIALQVFDRVGRHGLCGRSFGSGSRRGGEQGESHVRSS